MNCRCKNRKSLKTLTFWPVIYLCLITLPCNYSGFRITVRNKSFSFHSPSITPKLHTVVTTEKVERFTDANKDLKTVVVDRNSMVLTAFLVISVTILLSLILGYLHSVSTVKHCLMLYLYLEFVRTFLSIFWIWFIIVINCFVTGNGMTIDPSSAKFLSYCWHGAVLHLLFILNLMGVLKFYMTKEMVLDPSMPWNDDDLTLFKKLRIGSYLASASLLTAMYTTLGHPKIYYGLVGDYRPIWEFPTGTLISLGIVLFLITTYALISIGTIFYQKKDEHIGGRFPDKLNCLSKLAILLGFIVYFSVMMNIFKDGYLWIVQTLIASTLGILTRIILSTPQLKTYVQKVINRSTSEIIDFLHQTYAQIPSPSLFNFSSQIQPIE